MAKYTIEDTTLVSISDALRTVYGTTDLIKPADYASMIRALEITEKGLLLSKINTCVKHGNLDSISWSDIDEISAALVNGTLEPSEVSGLLGLYKTFEYESSKTCYAFIIGILQDYLDSTPRGFTFWCVGSNTPFDISAKNLHITTSKFGNSSSNTGGWGGTGRKDILRTALQSGGSIYNNMPSDMTAIMKSKTTYYGPDWRSETATVSSVKDIMFILSEKEIYNVNNASEWSGNENYDRPFWQYEGTGAAHNEQYQLFANEGISTTAYDKLTNSSSYFWVRTCLPDFKYGFSVVYKDGTQWGQYDTFTFGVAPCFCV